MRHPSAFYLDDQAVTSTGEPVTIRAFVTRSGGRQLVRVEYADGRLGLRSFLDLARPAKLTALPAEGVNAHPIPSHPRATGTRGLRHPQRH